MSELKVALEKAGLRDVQTYIQSGNIVCASTLAVPEVQQLVREVIHRKWGYEVEVQAYTLAAWRRILAQCPYSEQSKKLNFVFLEKAPAKRKLETIVQGMLKPSEKAAVYGRVVYLLCPEGLGKSKFNLDTLASQLGVQATCRNWNTVERLGVMLESPSG